MSNISRKSFLKLTKNTPYKQASKYPYIMNGKGDNRFELQTSLPALAVRKRKAKAQKINLKMVSGNKHDKVFAVYFKNNVRNK